MSAQHTPGPWVIGTDTRGDEVCTIHGVARLPTEDGEGQGWVYVHYPRIIGDEWHYASESEKLANARLIAAAPELLSTLIALEKWFDTDAEIVAAMPEAERADNERQLAKIRAAIAKAKGGAA